MIRILHGRTRGLRVVGPPQSPPTVPHVPAAVRPETLTRFAGAAKEIGRRWGVAAASSLLAHLEPASTAHDFVIGVQAHGPIAWVFSGEGMMRPFLPTPWFVVGDAWQALAKDDGVARQIAAAPDACLAAPAPVLDAVAEATGARIYATPSARLAVHPDADAPLQALAAPPRAEGRTIVGLAWYEGCVGPLALDVDTGTATLDARRQEPWKPLVLR